MGNQEKKHEEKIARFLAGIEELDAVLQGLSEAELDLAREEGKWTIRQIVHHIVDAEDIWETGIKAALGNSGCSFNFSWYITDNKCAEPLDYARRPIEVALELFKKIRPHVVELIEHLPGARERYVIVKRPEIPDGKKFTVDEIIDWQILHLNIHIEQILETRKKHYI